MDKTLNGNLKFDFVNEYLVEIEDYNPNQMSRDYRQRIESINHFCLKHKEFIINKNDNFYNSYKKELLARALMPGIKNQLKN